MKGCSECGAMGGARSSYRLCDNILDHGDLQVHLGLVQLLGALPHLYIATLPEKFLTIIKRNHMTSRKCYQEQIPQITNLHSISDIKTQTALLSSGKKFLPKTFLSCNVKCYNTIPVQCKLVLNKYNIHQKY